MLGCHHGNDDVMTGTRATEEVVVNERLRLEDDEHGGHVDETSLIIVHRRHEVTRDRC